MVNNKWILISIIIVIVISVLSIIGLYNLLRENENIYTENVLVHLYVSNQSDEDDPITITLNIDNIIIIHRTCYFDDAHTFYLFEFNITKGNHTINAYEKDNNIMIIDSNIFGNEAWIVISY